MRLAATFSTLVLVFITFSSYVFAAPTGSEQSAGLSKRENERITNAINMLNEFVAKRDSFLAKRNSPTDSAEYANIVAREYATVTEILSAINDTGYATKLIQAILDNEDLQPTLTSLVEKLIKDGTINLTTLFTALNDSGLAATVIKDIINDCSFYSEIYELALAEVENLASKVFGSSSSKRDLAAPVVLDEYKMMKRDNDSVLDNLLESVGNSGIATSVVEALLTDEKFLKYGASLLEDLFSSGTVTIGDVIDALTQSGIVTSLFKEFFTVDTLKTIIVNALKAASGTCDASSLSTLSATTTVTATSATGTSTSTSTTCKKRRKRSYAQPQPQRVQA